MDKMWTQEIEGNDLVTRTGNGDEAFRISTVPLGDTYLQYTADGRVFCRWPDGRLVEVIEKKRQWLGCTFEGPPPAGFASWFDWAAQNTYVGVTVRVSGQSQEK